MTAAAPGVYVHFPYCEHRCIYCDFALTTPRAIPADRFTDAILLEMEARGVRAARTFYVGGGTPSLWPVPQLRRVIDTLAIDAGAEVTLEANPEQCDAAWLADVTALGVNRVSLGVQSLDSQELALLTRKHGVAGAEGSLDALADAYTRGRLASFSVDLMYGLPSQTLPGFLAQLDRLVRTWQPPHVSLYALTVEPRTMLAKQIRAGVILAPDDALQGDALFAIRDQLGSQGFVHYEVSSWSKPGHIARHNSAYWDLTPYVGLGAGAHGFVDGRRYANHGRPSKYIDEVLAGRSASASDERVSADDLAFERIMIGLRRVDVGVAWGDDFARFADGIGREVARGRLVREGERLRVTDDGLRFLDAVLAGLR